MNPCDNFYQFACGGWEAKNPVPESEARWSQFNVLRVELSNALSTILTVGSTTMNINEYLFKTHHWKAKLLLAFLQTN